LYSNEHQDIYVHRNIDQLTNSKWYFHKHHTQTYKSGTFKGLDLTFGHVDTNFLINSYFNKCVKKLNENLEKNDIYGGILIRSIYDVTSNIFIEGSCNCVNHILKLYNVDKISDLTNNEILNVITNDKNFIIEKKQLEKEKIWIGKRVGLSNKLEEFRNKKYRFLIFKNKIKKQKKELELL